MLLKKCYYIYGLGGIIMKKEREKLLLTEKLTFNKVGYSKTSKEKKIQSLNFLINMIKKDFPNDTEEIDEIYKKELEKISTQK